MTWRHSAKILFAAFLMGMTGSAVAQTNSVTSHDIVVTHDKVDPTTGQAKRIATWNWLDYARYYDILMKQQIQHVLTPSAIAKLVPTGDVYTITQTNPEGDMERRMIVANGTVSSMFVANIPAYKYDVADILPQLLKDQPLLAAQTDKDGPALLRVTMLNDRKNNAVTWMIRDQAYVDKIIKQIKSSPQVEEHDWDGLPDFRGSGAVRLESQTGKIAGLPTLISFEDNVIRTTEITTKTLVYRDGLNIGLEAEGQKKLEDFYKERGLRPIRRY